MHKTHNKLILLGFCAGSIPVITEIAEEQANITHFDIVKNIDWTEDKRVYKLPEYTFKEYNDSDYQQQNFDLHPVHFAVLNSHIKYILYHYFLKKRGIQKEKYLTLIQQSSPVAKSATIAEGCLIEPLSTVSAFAGLGFGVTIKRKCSLGHHSVLGDFVNLNPGSDISGNVTVGEGTEIGTGTSVVNNVTIGKYCLIGAGSVVTRNIPDGVVAYGNPCKVVRTNERWVKAMELTGGNSDIRNSSGAPTG